MARLQRLINNVLGIVEDGGGPKAKARLKQREDEYTQLEAQHTDLEQRRRIATFQLTDGELNDVLAAMRADVQSDEVTVARRVLSLFIRAIDAERLVILYHEPDLIENARLHSMPPRGLVTSSCDGADRVRSDIAGTWLALVAAPPSQVWTDRTREIRKLREQGETLCNSNSSLTID